MLVFPNTKINIGLNITEKRKDGFHNLETIFYPIELSDVLEFVETNEETEFYSSGIKIDVSEKDNLVLKAYKLLQNDYKIPNLKIHLHKNVPLGAGLGGGSADASYMLSSLNEYFNLGISEKKLINYAQKLGSDCPFFIKNKPTFAEGTGNIFSDIDLDLNSYFIILVKPNIHVSTKDAFSNIKPLKPNISLNELIKRPVKEWKGLIINDFENSVFKLYPEINRIKDTLYNMG
ncbi:MAG: 4-(cytidine 5'-diphospho)-2-C-methyl-D-erythritol kinase, partial [Chlorobi bacterium]|nr:4-(cytidine 5'-diphospho)-2-C-methyl-D-erythritol kinase [Chlorobiota bacterium]